MTEKEPDQVRRARQRLSSSKYSPDEEGIWIVKGEDPNCDFGGSHVEPELGHFEGKYKDVVEYALTLPGFFQWGSGGSITKLGKPKKIDPVTNKRRKQLEDKKRQIEEELKQIEEELENS